MKFIRIVVTALLSALAADAFQQTSEQTIEEATRLAGSKVRLLLTTGEVLTGRLAQVGSDQVVLHPLNKGQAADRTLAITDIRTIRSLGFGDSLTGKILRTSGHVVVAAPFVALASPFIVFELGLYGGIRVVTGKWPSL